MNTLTRVTAAVGDTLTIALGGSITASATSRTIGGTVVRYGVAGHTSKGKLKVAPGALRFPDDLGTVKLTREHDRNASRGHLVGVEHLPDGVRASLKVSDGPTGDEALREATDRTRDGLSFDVVDAVIVGDTITSARVVAIGQVGIPAYEDGRIDTVAASNNPGDTMLTAEQRARLVELRAMTNRNAAETSQMNALAAMAGETPDGTPAVDPVVEPAATTTTAAPAAPAAPAATPIGDAVAASMPSVPAGVPSPTGPATTEHRGGALQRFIEDVTAGLAKASHGGPRDAITAALQDITHSAHTANIEQPAWTGELWSGLQYEAEFSDLYNTGTLTNWFGIGWRFTSKLEIADYAGDKAEIPSDNVTTEQSDWEAARMAVGVDIDRKFFDFPNEGFVRSMIEQVRESWAIKLDGKVRAYTLAKAVTAETVGSQTDLLKAVALAIRALKRRRVGSASWVYVNDDDLLDLFDRTNFDLPAYLDLWKVDPRNFRSSPDITRGTVLAGVKPAAEVKTLSGSPIRVEAQNLTRGGIDEAFFGYWAIEEHHTKGIAKVAYDPTP